MTVVVVTDSTASLPAAMAEAHGIEVVPLHVVVGRTSKAEGVDIDGVEVAALLREGRQSVTTSGPAPDEFVQVYREVAARRGATHIVSVHLSSRISRTVESAQLAAAAVRSTVGVTVVDSRTLGLAMGYAACDGADVAAVGASVGDVTALITKRAAEANAYFYVDTLEYLRRGGRIGAASAFFGGALAIKPLLSMAGGEVKPWERVRTRGKALARLQEQTLADIATHLDADRRVRVGIHHCDWAEQAQHLADSITEANREFSAAPADAESLSVDVVPLGAVTAVHTGPGTVAVVISPR